MHHRIIYTSSVNIMKKKNSGAQTDNESFDFDKLAVTSLHVCSHVCSVTCDITSIWFVVLSSFQYFQYQSMEVKS